MSGSGTRPRAHSDAPRDEHSPNLSGATQADAAGRNSVEQAIRDFGSPRRAATANSLDRRSTNLRRRSVATRRTSVAFPRPSLASRVPGNVTLAGPDDTKELRTAHEPFVHPGYEELNPSYAQPNNVRPVWSLAKPMPRVVRAGMVPTREEIQQARVNAELPAENSQQLGMDVDPNDLEQGKIKKSRNPAKVSAQVTDARNQREKNFLNALQAGGRARSRTSVSIPPSSIAAGGRTSTWAPGADLPAWEEQDNEQDEEPAGDGRPGKESKPQHMETLPEQSEADSSGGKDDDAQSATTAGGQEVIYPEYPEDVAPFLDSHIEDELHNNHTSWSVVRTHYREGLAELLAVMTQLTLGFCADLSVTVAKAGNPNTTDWAWGFATMIAIYQAGGVSGAHLNPTISIMLWFYRGFPKRKMPHYFCAQFLGAFLASLIAYGVYHASIQNYLTTNSDSAIVDSFVTSQRYEYIKPVNAFFNEFLGTACLAATVLALGDDQNAPPGAGMNAMIIGLVIVVLSMAFGFQTGAALNPSRDFGPRLALLALGYGSELFTNPYWVYGPWAGSLCGAFVGAGLYDTLIFTGGESPINYPWSRTKRAMLKSRTKWRRRLHLAPSGDAFDEKDARQTM